MKSDSNLLHSTAPLTLRDLSHNPIMMAGQRQQTNPQHLQSSDAGELLSLQEMVRHTVKALQANVKAQVLLPPTARITAAQLIPSNPTGQRSACV